MKNFALWITAAAFMGGIAVVASGARDEGRMPDLGGCGDLAQFRSFEQQRTAREGGAGQFLDLLLHQ